MLTCPECNARATQDTIVVENGLVTHYQVKANPAKGIPTLVPVDHDNSEASLTMICHSCGAESTLGNDVTFKISQK